MLEISKSVILVLPEMWVYMPQVIGNFQNRGPL